MKRLILLLVILSILPSGDLRELDNVGTEHTITVDGTNLRFYPTTLTVNEGDGVRFLWGGEVLPHNSVEENGLFDSGDPEREVDYYTHLKLVRLGFTTSFANPTNRLEWTGR